MTARRLATITAALALPATLAACGTTPTATTLAATRAPQSGQVMSDQAFLTEVYNAGLMQPGDYAVGQSVVKLAQAECAKIATDHSVKQVVYALSGVNGVQAPTNPDGVWSPTQAKWFVEYAVGAYCPENHSYLDR